MVPKERFLEWKVEEGWEPLCKFLDKDVPDEPFPHVNRSGDGFNGRVAKAIEARIRGSIRNFVLLSGLATVVVAATLKRGTLLSAASNLLGR